MSVLEAIRAWPEIGSTQLAVVDDDGTYTGVISIRAVVEARADGEHDDTAIARFCDNPEPVRVTDPLADALTALDATDRPLPVVDDRHAVVGWLTHSAVLILMRAGA